MDTNTDNATRKTARPDAGPRLFDVMASCEKVAPCDKPLPAVEDKRAVADLSPLSWNMFVFEKR